MATDFITQIRKSVCGEVELIVLDENAVQFVAPVLFDDGDSINVVLIKEGKTWYFTDQGDTLMHLSYMDLEDTFRGKRETALYSIMNAFDLKIRQGEIRSALEIDEIGECYFRFLHGLTSIINYAVYTSRDNVKSLFMDDFYAYLKEKFGSRCIFDYVSHEHDEEEMYKVDCAIEGDTKLFFFGITNASRCHTATITCLMFKQWEIPFKSIVIFDDKDEINKKDVARLGNVVDMMFSTLPSAKEGLPDYLSDQSIPMN